jgi:hypothetical protein
MTTPETRQRPWPTVVRVLGALGAALTLGSASVVGTAAAAAPAPVAHVTAAPAPAAPADDVLSWAVAPTDSAELGGGRPHFDYALEPGARVEDAITVVNRGSEPLTLAVYAADAFTTASGQLDLLAAGQPSTDAGTWVALAQDSVTVPVGGSVDVPFVVSVPADARPGDHTAGIVTSSASQGGGTVTLDRRLGARMYVRVAGELAASVAVEDLATAVSTGWPFAPARLRVTFTVHNTGSARVVASPLVAVDGPLVAAGMPVGASELPELLPGERRAVAVDLPGVWAAGPVTVRAEARAQPVGLGPTAAVASSAQVGATVLPWASVVVVVLVLACAVLVPVLVVRRRTGRAPAEVSAT